jgi:hypothetical protein
MSAAAAAAEFRVSVYQDDASLGLRSPLTANNTLTLKHLVNEFSVLQYAKP